MMAITQRPIIAAVGLGVLLALSGCFGPGPRPSPTISSSSAAYPSAPESPSPSISATAGMSPTLATPGTAPVSATPGPGETMEPTPTGLPEQVAPLTVYYVAVGDNGISGPMIGCGDSLVATKTAPVRFTDQVGPSINALLANRSRTLGQSGLVNVLYQSTLTYLGGTFDGTTITVYLQGQFMLAGVCDILRAKAQLEQTAVTAAGAKRAVVFVNGRPIDDVLSLK